MSDRFSKRQGFGKAHQEVTIRDDAPYQVREGVLKIAEGDLRLGPSFLRDVLCEVLRKLPDRSNWSDYPSAAIPLINQVSAVAKENSTKRRKARVTGFESSSVH
jgi:hypothetical protein